MGNLKFSQERVVISGEYSAGGGGGLCPGGRGEGCLEERDDFGSQMFDQTHFVKIIDSALKKTFLSTLVKITSFESSRYLTFLPQRHF